MLGGIRGGRPSRDPIGSTRVRNAGNLTTVTPPTPLGTTTYTYDSLSRVASVTDGRGVRLDYGYDKLDRVVSVTKHSTNVVLEADTYDNNGSLTRRETATAVHTFTYDTGGLLRTDTRTDGTSPTEVLSYTYSPATNLKSMTDPGGTTTYGRAPGVRGAGPSA
ncbi:hypothetical protein AB0F91_44590 [Amycolatopsis sp. NPDC023774]|uniref:hypothetical protein n=1 Tax=Amycolatopsis sp. NPDC023774 TaxID=3155015 RepID=UPI0033E29A39